MATTKEEALAKIAASATTPLNPDESERQFHTWHDAKQEKPQENVESLLYTIVHNFTIGHWYSLNEVWITDLGTFQQGTVTHWAVLPDAPVEL